MNLKTIAYLFVFIVALVGCDDKKESKEALAEKERIAFEKTADSLTAVNARIDSLTTEIQETSEEIDALLNEVNQQ